MSDPSDPFHYKIDPPASMQIFDLLDHPTKIDAVYVPAKPSYTKSEGSLNVLRECVNGFNALVHQGATGDSKWVDINDIRKRGLSHAYYDSDPTYLPEGEKP